MQDKIRYVPYGSVLDLSEPDLGQIQDILQHHHRQSERPGLGFSKENPAFICLDHEGSTNPGLFLQKRGGAWFAIHYDAGDCRSEHRLPGLMSDEHKRQTEYWARAAQDAGWHVELEHALPTGTRPDALIRGPVLTGVEVQRSAMTASGAVTRTSKAADADVTDVWFTAGKRTPKWLWRVPTVLSYELGIDRPLDDEHTWDTMPPRRAVTAAGLRKLEPVKCTMVNFNRCPYGRNWCGRYHPRPRFWSGLTVDDVAARLPAGEMKPLRFWGVTMLQSRRRDAVFLVSPADFARYEELTGWSGSVSFRPDAEDRPLRTAGGPVKCRNVQPAAQQVPMPEQVQTPQRSGIWGIDPQSRMWCDSCGDLHPIIEHRNCRAAQGDLPAPTDGVIVQRVLAQI